VIDDESKITARNFLTHDDFTTWVPSLAQSDASRSPGMTDVVTPTTHALAACAFAAMP
jgi:hypothetical protein